MQQFTQLEIERLSVETGRREIMVAIGFMVDQNWGKDLKLKVYCALAWNSYKVTGIIFRSKN